MVGVPAPAVNGKGGFPVRVYVGTWSGNSKGVVQQEGGLVVRGDIVRFLFGSAAFFPHRGQKFLVSGSGVPHSVQKCMGVDRFAWGDKV
jgi:hypothetical protein